MANSRESSFNVPVGGSWRMVEGGNESFDTSYVNEPFEDPLSSGPSQNTSFSQETDSQDSIHDFADKADEDQVILRAPFQPSIASTRNASINKDHAPIPEFFMPTVDTSSPRRSRSNVSGSPRMRTTATTGPVSNDAMLLLRKGLPRQESANELQAKHSSPRTAPSRIKVLKPSGGPPRQPGFWEKITTLAPEFFFDCLSWIMSVFGMALRLIKWPIAVLVAIYLAFAVLTIGKNMITQSVTTSLQPVCQIPGASLLNLPFCPSTLPGGVISHHGTPQPIEFDGLMKVQSQFEKVLEDSAEGVSLPMEMLRSEASLRDLRTLVKYSELPARNEMVYEFDGYITAIHETSRDLQVFNTHVGGAVDSVININRWTSRYIDSIITKQEERRSSLLSWGIDWLFSPFRSPVLFEERFILDKYIEHTAFVSDKIADLILEAQAILRLLSVAEEHLQIINEHVVRSSDVVQQRHSEVFYTLWTILGVNNSRLHNLNKQLSLLKRVDDQRRSAIRQLISLIHDLSDIQSKLGDLRDRVAAPELLADNASIPLQVHIQTINAGVARLEKARSRIRAEEDERLQRALNTPIGKEKWIEG